MHINPSRSAMSRPYSVVMLGRALAILEQVAASGAPIGVTMVATDTGVPKSTTFRLLRLLCLYGFVERVGNRYAPGPGMRRLAQYVANGVALDLRQALMPYLVDLFERTGDVVTLGVLDGTDVVVVEQIRGHRHESLPRGGFRLPAHCSAIGKLLLASRAGSEAAVLDSTLAGRTPRSIVDPAELRAELAVVRRRGMAVSREEEVVGVVDIALPVVGRTGATAAIARSRPAGSSFADADIAVHREVALAASIALRRVEPQRRVPRQAQRS